LPPQTGSRAWATQREFSSSKITWEAKAKLFIKSMYNGNLQRDRYFGLNIDSGLYFPLGALLFTKATYTETLKWINTTGVPYIPYAPGETYGYNWTTGVTSLEPVPPAAFDALLETEVVKYITYWQSNFAPYSDAPGYKVS